MMEELKNPMVSVVITTHNRKAVLLRVIESVMRQTYDNIEIIVTDDKSTDGTELEIKKIKDERLKYIYIPKEESKGGNHARNVGLSTAKGKYVAFLDDDDFWLPNKLSLQVKYMLEHLDVKMVYCFRYFFYDYKYCRLEKIKDVSVGDVSETVFTKIITSTSTMMFDRESLTDVGGFDEELGFWQETELMIRFAQKYHIGCVREPLVLYTAGVSDPNKLSNKYEEWRKTVKYIESKHSGIMKKFSKEQKEKWDLMVCKDAINRCNTNRLKLQRKKLYDEACRYSTSTVMKIKRLLNYNATSACTLKLRILLAKLNIGDNCEIGKIILQTGESKIQ